MEKYFPIALNSVMQEFMPNEQGGMSEENKGKIQQMKLKLKF